MRNGQALSDVGREVIRTGQAASGAYIAAPSFPNYRFSWFRDGAFTAYAMQLTGDLESAHRFHQWAIRMVLSEARRLQNGGYFRARYPADGEPSDDPWPNFQLDGLGIWLWSVNRFQSTQRASLVDMYQAVEVAAKYLSQRWSTPCFDCWEENGDQVHLSTLAAIHGGLRAAGEMLAEPRWVSAANAVREFALERGTLEGRFRKNLGTDLVDASLLWAATPFRLVEPDHPVMRRTVDEIVKSLTGPSGGMWRYRGDSYYGGGEWVLLTAHLGWYFVEVGELEQSRRALGWVEAAADGSGYLAEQLLDGAQLPERIAEWKERWGPVAKPLLWSHAAHLILDHCLHADS